MVLAILSIAIFGFGPAVNAQSADIQAQIQALLQQIAAMQARITALQAQQSSAGGDAPANQVDTWCHTFNTNLGYAQTGNPEVAELHRALDKERISYSPDAANIYAGATALAVRSFQAKYGILPSNGWSGPATRTKLNQLYGCQNQETTSPCLAGSGPLAPGQVRCPVNQPSVTVTSPNGGETWRVGETKTISWTSTGLNSSKLLQIFLERKLTTDNQYWNIKTIATLQPQNGSYNWTIPADIVSTGATYKIMVSEHGLSGLEKIDESDNYFTIAAAATTCTPGATMACNAGLGAGLQTCNASGQWGSCVVNQPEPTIAIISPNGGEGLVGGQVANITWRSTGLSSADKIKILLKDYTDISNPSTRVIAENLAGNLITRGWTIPLDITTGTKYKIEMEVDLSAENFTSLFDESNNYFSITQGAALAITSPAAGETFVAGSTQTVTWTTTGTMPYVALYLYKGNTYVRNLFAPYTYGANQGSKTWTIPANLTAGNDYKIKVVKVGDATVFAESEPFSVSVTGQSISVTYPNGAEDWKIAESHEITWTTAGSAAMPYVRIDLYKGNSFFRNVVAFTPNDGSHAWVLPTNLETLSDYKIRVSKYGDATIFDESDAGFTIGSIPQGITVTSPNGGETLPLGSNHTITWSTEGTLPIRYVRIDLLKAGVVLRNIISYTTNNGTYNWTIPSTLPASNDYKIKISQYGSTTVFDESDANFTMGAVSQAITLTSPAGGETWPAGSVQTITWSSTGTTRIAYIKLDLYKGGTFVKNILAPYTYIGNTGSYRWTVPTNLPAGAGNDYAIKITNAQNPAVYNMSNNFTIGFQSANVSESSNNLSSLLDAITRMASGIQALMR